MQKIVLKLFIALTSIAYAGSFLEAKELALVFLLGLSLSFLLEMVRGKYRLAFLLLYVLASVFFPSLLFSCPVIITSIPGVNRIGQISLGFFLSIFCIKNSQIFIVSLLFLAYFASYLEIRLNQYKDRLFQKDDEFKVFLKEQKKAESRIISEKSKDIEIAILSERNRISRELHDSVGHTISGAIIQSEAMKKPGDSTLNAQIDALQSNLKNGMADIRSSLHALHDRSMDLELALKDLIDANPSIRIDLNYRVSSDFSYQVKQSIKSVIKESIANSLKHSDASLIKITFIEMPKHLSIAVEDNGDTGFNGQGLENHGRASLKYGMGFMSFKEFANAYNGRFTYEYESGLKLMFLLDKESLFQ